VLVKLQISGLLFSVLAAGAAADPAVQIKRTCTRCHNLDVVRAQRLSREEWATELEKMASMGAKIKDRAALLDYLTRKYGPDGKRR
jgi:hypothetical protein